MHCGCVRRAGDFELSGQLDERQLGQFQQVNQQFRREFGTHPTLELINQTRTPVNKNLYRTTCVPRS